MSKFYDVKYDDISKIDLLKALEQLTFIRNTTRAWENL